MSLPASIPPPVDGQPLTAIRLRYLAVTLAPAVRRPSPASVRRLVEEADAEEERRWNVIHDWIVVGVFTGLISAVLGIASLTVVLA